MIILIRAILKQILGLHQILIDLVCPYSALIIQQIRYKFNGRISGLSSISLLYILFGSLKMQIIKSIMDRLRHNMII